MMLSHKLLPTTTDADNQHHVQLDSCICQTSVVNLSVTKLLNALKVGSILFLLYFTIGCSDAKKAPNTIPNTQANGFQVPSEFSAVKTLVYQHDMNADGKDDAVLVVFDTTDRTITKATLMYYSFDTASSAFTKRGTVEIDDVESLDFRSVTSDAIPEMLVYCNGGGSSETASKGLEIYQLKNNSDFVLFRSYPYGEPELWQSDTTVAILIHDRFTGIFSKSESAVYVDSVSFLEPMKQNEYEQRRIAVMREIEMNALQTVDTLLLQKPKDVETQRLIFTNVVNRVMILKKLNRNREADDYTRSIVKKSKFLSRSILDALDELRSTAAMPL